MRDIKYFIKDVKSAFLLLKSRFKMANVSDSAAVTSFYAILSLFPIGIVLGNVLRMLNVSVYRILYYLKPVLPETIFSIIKPIITSALQGSNSEKLSIGLIITIWSASRAIAAFQRNVDRAYGIEKNGAFINRIISFVWTLLLILLIMVLILFLGFSKFIINYVVDFIGISANIADIFSLLRIPITLLGLFALIVLLFYFVPSANVKMKYVWVGSLFSLLGSIILSKGFTIYLHYFMKNIDAYKTLGAFVVLMMWFYLLGIIFLSGTVINATLQDINHEKIYRTTPNLKELKIAKRKNR
ncbi:YihY/virulence factor BrkB family protein [Apilactobacillus xinyiensis]|uniref:YihY/virulence factor BrkB family protein n=1 Tax=Apilactobacillus xinyiensis TaxID=2841032 RepID=UPI001C7CBF9D|nr:YihY/virulence factor BrkB family protein [Apilactobacillus xinyiensis]MCL0329716.1 YihY/virulence factor BrkB family protein [Apilactobacillus xinyiensis]